MGDDCDHEWVENESESLEAVICTKCGAIVYLNLNALRIVCTESTSRRKRIRDLETAIRGAFPVTEGIDGLFTAIRNDWTDPRSECRAGWAAVEELRGLLMRAVGEA